MVEIAKSQKTFCRSYDNQEYTKKMEVENGIYCAIDERSVASGWDSESIHWHDYFEIEIVISGSGTYLYENQKTKIGTGFAYFLTPANIHAVIPDKEETISVLHIRFNEYALCEDVLKLVLLEERCFLVNFTPEELKDIVYSFKMLEQDFEKPRPEAERLIRLDISRICLAVFYKSSDDSLHSTASAVLDKGLQRAYWFMRCNFQKRIRLQDVAAVANISPNHFSMLFKKNFGCSYSDMVQHFRLQYAANMLKTTTVNIDEIAYETGFSSGSHFIAAFKKEMGVTPKEFREKSINTSTVSDAN